MGRLRPLLLLFFLQISLFREAVCDMNDLGDVADAIGNLFGAVDDCEFKCPGGKTPRPNRSYKKASNGCGSYGVQFQFNDLPGITSCCDRHDLCYGTCGEDKVVCDRKFKKCVNNLCDSLRQSKTQVKECRTIGKLLFGGTATLGCEAFLTTQREACVCTPPRTRSHRTLHDFDPDMDEL